MRETHARIGKHHRERILAVKRLAKNVARQAQLSRDLRFRSEKLMKVNAMKKIKIKSPDIRLVTVCIVNDPVEAELIKNTLLDHEIECELDGEHQAGFTGTLGIDVVVRETDAKEAREIVQIHHPQ